MFWGVFDNGVSLGRSHHYSCLRVTFNGLMSTNLTGSLRMTSCTVVSLVGMWG